MLRLSWNRVCSIHSLQQRRNPLHQRQGYYYYRTTTTNFENREVKKLYSQEIIKIVRELREKVASGSMKPEEMQKVMAEKINQTRSQHINDLKNDPKLQQRKKVVQGDRFQPLNQPPERKPNVPKKDNEEEEE